jgi:hypothetical protein
MIDNKKTVDFEAHVKLLKSEIQNVNKLAILLQECLLDCWETTQNCLTDKSLIQHRNDTKYTHFMGDK